MNYRKVNLGKISEIKDGKEFLHDLLNLTGCEISLNSAKKGFKVPFSHKHKQNEEVYIVIKGEGIITVDGEKIKVSEGSCVNIKPAASRTIENSGDGEFQFICIQAKNNSLEQFGLGDAELC